MSAAEQDYHLLKASTIAPVGNLRIKESVPAPVIGGDELISVTIGGEDVVAIGESGTGLSAPDVVETADEQSMIKERYSEGTASPSPALKNPPTPLASCEYIHHSPVSGLILHRKPLGARIRPSEMVAEIIDPVTDQITPLVAEHDGVLYARHWVRFATAGMLVVRLAGEREIRSGDLLVV